MSASYLPEVSTQHNTWLGCLQVQLQHLGWDDMHKNTVEMQNVILGMEMNFLLFMFFFSFQQLIKT